MKDLNEEVSSLIRAGRYEEVLPLALQAHAAAPVESDENEDYATSLYHLIVVYRGLGQADEANRALGRLIALCSAAFVRKDYSRTIKLTYDLKELAPPFLPMRLLLMSFQRLGEPELIDHFHQLLAECVNATTTHPWDRALLILALGLSGWESVLAQAQNEDQKCQANYYMAANLITRGYLADSQHHLKACLAIASDCPERHLALAEYLALQDLPLSGSESVDRPTSPPAAVNDAFNKKPDPDELFEMRIQLANRMKRALSFYDQGHFQEAITSTIEIRDNLGRLIGEEHADYATCCHNLGMMYRAVGQYAKADSSTRKALEIRRRVHGAWHPLIAQSLSQLGDICRRVGSLSEAERLALEAQEVLLRVGGDKNPAYATALNNLALVYRVKGKYVAAEPLFRQALNIYLTHYGQGHSHFLQAMNNLGNLLALMGRFKEAESLLQQSVAGCCASLGNHHPRVAQSLINLASLYSTMGKNAESKPLLEKACAIIEASLGAQHPEYAAALNNLGTYYLNRGEYETAERLLKQAMEIGCAATGKKGDDYATHLNNLAVLYGRWGKYTVAAEYMDQAAELWRSVLGENSPAFARSLLNQASTLQELGNYVAAMERIQSAGVILGEVLGEQHSDYADYLFSMATLHGTIGDYPQAIRFIEKSLGIRRSVLGDDHSAVAIGMSTLGVYLSEIGDVTSAERLFRDAAVILEAGGEHSPEYIATLQSEAGFRSGIADYETAVRLLQRCIKLYNESTGGTHPNLGHCLTTLASICVKTRRYDQADRLLSEAVEICRNTVGENHTNYAAILNHWSNVAFYQREYSRAEELSSRALEIWSKTLSDSHPHYAIGLNDLAVIKRHQGDLHGAELLHRQAVELLQKLLGSWHPECSLALVNLACSCLSLGKQDEALDLFDQAVAIDDRMIGQVFSIGSERQRMAYVESLEYRFHLYLSVVTQFFPDFADAVRGAFEMILRRKAIGAEAQAAQRDAILTGRYPSLESTLNELITLKRQIAQKRLAGPGREGTRAFLEVLAVWDQEKQRQEAQLAREIPEMNLESQLRKADLHEISSNLPEGVALIEFVRFHVADFHALLGRGERQWKSDHYLAFVVSGGNHENLDMIDLGDTAVIDRLINDLRAAITGETEDEYSSDPVSSPDFGGDFTKIGCVLREQVFDKLIPALAGCKRLMLAPDGNLSRLPFEVLSNPMGRELIDDYFISYLSCGRDLLRIGTMPWHKPTVPLVIADPDFNLTTATAVSFGSSSTYHHRSRDLDHSDICFERLPGTRDEGERISEMLGVQAWLETNALEAPLRSCRSPRILHLATHGFFLSDQQAQPPNQELHKFNSVDQLWPRLAGLGLENPLLRSGLALAGANTFLKHGNLPAEAEDGILTGEDVSGLDLSDTELVVLSACDTGLGEVRVGEGVFGLRRSFVLAGAKTLVMSLWKVSDEETRELMEDFYRRLLAGESRADALRGAQLAIKSKYSDPFYWGAFICQGDPGPLSSPL